MLRALIATTVTGAAMLAVSTATPTVTHAAPKPGATAASFTMQSDPSFGGTASFSATYSPMKWTAEESVSCSENGTEVYLSVQTAPSTAQPWASAFTMWSQTWASAGGGPATCEAQLYYYTWQGKTETSIVLLSTLTFSTT